MGDPRLCSFYFFSICSLFIFQFVLLHRLCPACCFLLWMGAQLLVGSHWYRERRKLRTSKIIFILQWEGKSLALHLESLTTGVEGGTRKIYLRNLFLFLGTRGEAGLVSRWFSWHWVGVQCPDSHPLALHFAQSPGACWRSVNPLLLLIPPV